MRPSDFSILPAPTTPEECEAYYLRLIRDALSHTHQYPCVVHLPVPGFPGFMAIAPLVRKLEEAWSVVVRGDVNVTLLVLAPKEVV